MQADWTAFWNPGCPSRMESSARQRRVAAYFLAWHRLTEEVHSASLSRQSYLVPTLGSEYFHIQPTYRIARLLQPLPTPNAPSRFLPPLPPIFPLNSKAIRLCAGDLAVDGVYSV
jgi:hypothetical protein